METKTTQSSAISEQPQLAPPTPKSWKRSIAIAGVTIASLYGAVCAGLWFGQTRIVFSPQRQITTTPAEFNAKYEDVLIPVTRADGTVENRHGWWIPNPNQAQSNGGSDLRDRKVLLYLHGNSKNISANARHANRLMRLGFSVLIIDYRGYGKSEGDWPSEADVYTDAQFAWNYLRQKGFKPSQITVYGHSLGGAIAIDLATKNPDMAGLIIDASFTSMSDMALTDPKYRIFPIDLLIHQRFDSLSKVGNLIMPVLYIHGSADKLIPAEMSQRLYAATPSRKKLVIVPNGGHNNNATTNESLYASSIRSFFNL
ncbi:alpha/beta hydrolase [Pseudanabaena mucicola]|uniref:Alpha/beta fold hydrolase n=1 Tax=Pseudanabaena mucicola FACHB-723 TaxID=2692860 RepID=A0ABR7ZYX2_9CYAN|nr:alpha/beta fold hydrolase [Pseudanabaena mucicola]MBD2188685.1 alpha/beta fold hydrolase [Pseudanabaena mucicola FACHB-723]